MGDVNITIAGDPSGAIAAFKATTAAGVDVSDRLNNAFKTLGIKSAADMDNAKAEIVSAFEQIKNSGVASTDEITRAEAAKADALEKIDRDNFAKREGMLDKFKEHWLGIAAGLVSAEVIADFLKESMKASLENEIAFNKLKIQIEGMGIAYKSVSGAVNEATEATSKYARAQDDDVAKTLQELIFESGKVDESMKNLNLTYDLAYQKGIDVSEAASLIGKAMTGNIEMLGRYFPELHKMNETLGENATEAQKAAYGMTLLAEKSAGAMEKMTESEKHIAEAKKVWQDFKEAVGGALREAVGGVIGFVEASVQAANAEAGLGAAILDVSDATVQAQEAVSEAHKKTAAEIAKEIKALNDAIEADKKRAESIAGVISALEKNSDVIKTIGADAIKIGSEKFQEQMQDQEDSVKGMETVFKDYSAVIDESYKKQLSAQKALNSALEKDYQTQVDIQKNILSGMTQAKAKPEDIKEQQKVVYEAEKSLVQAKLQADKNYYDIAKAWDDTSLKAQIDNLNILKAAHKKAYEDIETLAKEWAQKLSSIDTSIKNITDTRQQLEKAMQPPDTRSEWQKYMDTQADLKKQFDAAMQINDPEKNLPDYGARVKALEDYHKAAVAAAKEVKDGNTVIVSQDEAQAEALNQVKNAEEAAADFRKKAGIQASDEIGKQIDKWQSLQAEIDKSKDKVNDVRQKVIELGNQLQSLEMKINTTAAVKAINQFQELLSGIPGASATAPAKTTSIKLSTDVPPDNMYGPGGFDAWIAAARYGGEDGTPKASGTSYVPKTGMYQLHQGEQVLTRTEVNNQQQSRSTTIQTGDIIIQGENKSPRELAREIKAELKKLEYLQ